MRVLAMAPSCDLDETGLRLQLERYRVAGRGARLLRRTQGCLVVKLAADVDGELVDETIAIERQCCPFLTLDWEPDSRQITVSVSEPAHESALDAIAFALDLDTSDPTPDA